MNPKIKYKICSWNIFWRFFECKIFEIRYYTRFQIFEKIFKLFYYLGWGLKINHNEFWRSFTRHMVYWFFNPWRNFCFVWRNRKKIAKNIFGKNKVSFCLINCHLVSVVKNKFEEYVMNTNFVRFTVFR